MSRQSKAASRSKKSANSNDAESQSPAKRSFNEVVDKIKQKKKFAKYLGEKTTVDLGDEPESKIIWDDDIAKLEITEEKLQKAKLEWATIPPKTKRRKKKTVFIKKPIYPEGTKLENFFVLRPAQNDAPVRPIDIRKHTGPKCDSNGIIPHSILGSVQEFTDEAWRRGEFKCLFDIHKPEIKPCSDRVLESSSMKAWRYQNKDWEILEQYLSDKVNRPVEHLIMNTVEKYSSLQRDRNVVSTALDVEQHGHGPDRECCSFWKQQTKVGDDIGGIFATLKKSERGYLNPVELAELPSTLPSRKSTKSTKRQDLYPAFHTPYLDEQKENVKDIIDKIIPHQPIFDNLSVVGDGIRSDLRTEPVTKISTYTLSESESHRTQVNSETSVKEEVSHPAEPSIIVCGKSAKWEGDENSKQGQIGVITSVTFDGLTNERVTGNIEIINTGSTSICFDWKKVIKPETFSFFRSKIQRFYFFEEGGAIPPKGNVKIPVIFKSPNGGIFSERWKLLTRPVLCGGADIMVVFKGVAQSVSVHKEEFDLIEKRFLHQKSKTVVSELIEELLNNIYTREHCIPVQADICQERLFHAENPKFIFHWSTVESMRSLYESIKPPENTDEKFSVCNLHKILLDLNEDHPDTQKHIENFVAMTTRLLFHWPKPMKNKKTKNYLIGYHLMGSAVKRFCDLASCGASMLKLPLIKSEVEINEEMLKLEKSSVGLITVVMCKSMIERKRQGVQQKKANKGKKKDKDADPSKQGNLLLPGPGDATSVSRSALTTSPEVSKSTSRESFCPVLLEKLSKEQKNKYRECLYYQAYNILSETVLQMVDLMEE